MKRYSTSILRLALFAAAAIVLFVCGVTLWMAVKTERTSDYYYLSYVLFIGTSLATIPFFIAIIQSYKLLGLIDSNNAFSQESAKALCIIARSAFVEFLICALGGLPFFYIVAEKDDAPGLILIGIIIAGCAFVISVFASVLNRLLQQAIAIKAENDLTI